MGGAAPRFLWLLTTPFPLLRRRHHHHSTLLLLSSHFHRLSSSTSSPSLSPLLFAPSPLKIKASQQQQRFQTAVSSTLFSDDPFSSPSPHPWPEWYQFLSHISPPVYLRRPPPPPADVGEFASPVELPPQFLSDASACLAFARERPNLLRLLSSRDVAVVVEHGVPFLFRDAEDSMAKMKAFLSNTDATVLETEKATMVDLMKFMLSYASSPLDSSESSNLNNRDLVESSVRNLFGELCKLSYNAPGSNSSVSMQNQMPDGFGQTVPPGQKIEMKRGDWICPGCSFMNFARNVKCRECQKARPKRQLAGGEWDCPQCDFYNYGRNMTCLRCDCKRPGQVSMGPTNTMSNVGYGNGDNTNTLNFDSRLAANEEKAQRWFSKVSQLDNNADINSLAADEDFPEIMPLRKGVNRFVVNTRKTPLERRLADAKYRRNLGNNGTAGPADFKAEESAKSSIDPLFSADTLAQKSEKLKTEESTADVQYARSGDNSQLSDNSASQNVIIDKEKEQDEKSERWFRKVAELHDVSDLSTAISDEDFPEIMPMRKGENRFVVSKKKDRSLISPAYKRRAAMEQSANTNFVPFVPFPPDYFAKMDKQQADETDSAGRSNVESSSISETADKPLTMSGDARARTEFPGANNTQLANAQRFSGVSGKPPEILDDARLGWERRETIKEIADQNLSMKNWSPKPSEQSSSNSNQENSGNMYSTNENKEQVPNSAGSSSPASGHQSAHAQWTGKSLEGSAVKEPDPLDMSEEAKAERWFRRVAQIKDISELSQIPDEDFPSIMPMRKGVNRFVVSKRKTPLERRLTSQQYRRNLPIVSSDPVKNENDGS